MTDSSGLSSRADDGETFANGEYRFKLGDQWYYRGNRSPSWFYVASRADGSCQGGISERVEYGSMCKLLNDIAERLAAPLSEQRTLAPHVDGQDFYELCQSYRHSRELMPNGLPNTVQAFNDLRTYIKTGKLPWPSYESSERNER